MQWTIKTVFILIAAIAGMLGVVRAFWVAGIPNYQIFLAFYLLVLAAIIAAAIPADAILRGGLIGAMLFGTAYLACVLKGGFAVQTLDDAKRFVRHVYLGLALLPISFLLSHLCTAVFWSPRSSRSESPP